MLKIEKLNVSYGHVRALYGVDLEIGDNEIVSVIGANGAGKSTMMKSVISLVKPSSGTITFNGENITGMPSHRIVRKGVTYVPEGRIIFPELSVRENLEMGAYTAKLKRSELNDLIEEQYALFPRLKERMNQWGGTLSGGEQQMLAISRGLMNRPKLLMLDEPSLGLAPKIVDEVFETIVKINQTSKIPILLVEQNAYMALQISRRAYVLEVGEVSMAGDSAELMQSDAVIKAYLGGK